MSLSRVGLCSCLLLMSFGLSACGDQWVAVYSNDVFPYGNGRTAGSGVVYVTERMMPEKEIKVKALTDHKISKKVEKAFEETLAK